MKKFISLFFMGTLLFFAGCSTDDDKKDTGPTGPSVSSDAPAFKIHQIQIPAKMQTSSDEHAQTVVFYMNMANIFGSTLNGNFVPPSLHKAAGDGPWEHNWQDGDLNIKVLIQKLTNKYTWEVIYNGSNDDQVYQNFVAFRAEQALDERSGVFFAYVPNTTFVLGQYAWSLNENDALNFEVVADAFLQGAKFVGLVNADHSGTLHVIQTSSGQELVQEKYQWDKDGNGEWWEYDDLGNVLDSGTWT